MMYIYGQIAPIKGNMGMNNQMTKVFREIEMGVYAALETYSNVHRGSGHNSMVTTHLYEQARSIVLEYLGLKKHKFVVIFCTPRRAEILKALMKKGSYQCVSSKDIGLPLGIRALAVERKALPKGVPFQTGGGSASLISYDWVVWAGAPDRFEAGTPSIINIIAFARALQMIRQFGKDAFREVATENLTVRDLLYDDELDGYSGQKLLDELRQTLIGRNTLVPTAEGARPFINLDYAASTPTFIPVWDTARRTWFQSLESRKQLIREVRSVCAGMLGAPQSEYDIIFTSNTTEAINLAAESLNRDSGDGIASVVLNTMLEHSSNELPWRMYPALSHVRLPIDAEGFIDLKELEKLLDAYNRECRFGNKRIRIVAVSGASNVLGTFNDLEEISTIVHKYGAHLLVDAAQMVAHRKVTMDAWGIDYLAFSAHKVYAPFGTGVLVVRKGLLNFNADDLELIQSSGEENPGGIAALGKALVLLQKIGLDLIREEEQALIARALRGLVKIPGLQVYGIKDPASPGFERKGGVIVLRMKGAMSMVLAKELAERGGIGTRYGCHCAHLLIKHLLNVSPGLERFQHVLLTLFPNTRLPGLLRVSFGIGTSEKDIDTLIRTLNNIAVKSRTSTGKEVKRRMKDFAKAASQRVYFNKYIL
jgi:selenocysteine lyase/cysteine desulfurase